MGKQKNPLYVVKGKDVEEAEGLLDLMIKKLNLQPVINFLNMLFKLLLESVNSYPAFLAIKKVVDTIVARLELFKKFSFA